MSEENKAVMRRWIEEAHNKRNLDIADEVIDPAFVWRLAPVGEIRGPEALKEMVRSIHAAFPDWQVTVEDQIAVGDMVATRKRATGTHQGAFMGIAPTGKQVTTSTISIARVAEGKLVEGWEVWDAYGMLQQLGAAPQSTEANKALARRFFDDFLNKREWALAEEIFADDFVYRASNLPELHGPEAMKQLFIGLQAGFPDYQYAMEQPIAEGDKLVVRWTWTGTHNGEWMGVGPTGKSIWTSGVTILRISGGRIVEHWAEVDFLGFFQQVGVVPPLGKGEEKAAA